MPRAGRAGVGGQGGAAGDRGRVRGQAACVSGAGGCPAVEEDGASGQDHDVAGGRAGSDGADFGQLHEDQDGSDEGRQAHRGQGAYRVRVGGVPRFVAQRGGDVHVLALRDRQHPHRQLRRCRQHAEHGGIPRAGSADRRVRGGVCHRRDSGEARNRPRGIAIEERGAGGDANGERRGPPSHRGVRDDGDGVRAPALQRAARGRAHRARRRVRLVGERRGAGLRDREPSDQREVQPRRGVGGHRRNAHGSIAAVRRGARHPGRGRDAADRGHRLHRLHVEHRREQRRVQVGLRGIRGGARREAAAHRAGGPRLGDRCRERAV